MARQIPAGQYRELEQWSDALKPILHYSIILILHHSSIAYWLELLSGSGLMSENKLASVATETGELKNHL
jgi:hypothetical protein